jgi:hypothetical protein
MPSNPPAVDASVARVLAALTLGLLLSLSGHREAGADPGQQIVIEEREEGWIIYVRPGEGSSGPSRCEPGYLAYPAPVYRPPVYRHPVYRRPVYRPPAYAHRAYRSPVYRPPAPHHRAHPPRLSHRHPGVEPDPGAPHPDREVRESQPSVGAPGVRTEHPAAVGYVRERRAAPYPHRAAGARSLRPNARFSSPSRLGRR